MAPPYYYFMKNLKLFVSYLASQHFVFFKNLDVSTKFSLRGWMMIPQLVMQPPKESPVLLKTLTIMYNMHIIIDNEWHAKYELHFGQIDLRYMQMGQINLSIQFN
jgi:hypothetical protein